MAKRPAEDDCIHIFRPKGAEVALCMPDDGMDVAFDDVLRASSRKPKTGICASCGRVFETRRAARACGRCGNKFCTVCLGILSSRVGDWWECLSCEPRGRTVLEPRRRCSPRRPKAASRTSGSAPSSPSKRGNTKRLLQELRQCAELQHRGIAIDVPHDVSTWNITLSLDDGSTCRCLLVFPGDYPATAPLVRILSRPHVAALVHHTEMVSPDGWSCLSFLLDGSRRWSAGISLSSVLICLRAQLCAALASDGR